MAESRQMPFDLAMEPRFGEDDFLVGPSNAEAYRTIGTWPAWPSRTLALVGPEASGKSHLAAIWAARAGASSIGARSLSKDEVPDVIAAGSVVVEDIDSEGIDEAALFHLVNLAQEREAFLLLTAACDPAEMSVATPDLQSRLRRAPVVRIAPPDDASIRALLVKLFADRQLIVDAALIEYLTLRIERSFVALRATVERLDRESLARGRRLTRQAAGEILGWSGDG